MKRTRLTTAAIEAVYAAALAPGRWGEACEALSAAFDRLPVMLLVSQPLRGVAPLTVDHGLDPDAWPRFHREFASGEANQTLLSGLSMPIGVPFVFKELMSEAGFYASPVYHYLFRPQGVEPWMNVIAAREGGAFAGVGVQATRRHRAPTAAERARVTRLSAHVGRAVRLGGLLIQTPRGSDFESALDAMSCAVFLTNEALAVTWTNTAASALLARRDGLDLVRGALAAADPADAQRLARAQATALQDGVEAALTIARPSGLGELFVRILPLGPEFEGRRRRLGLFVSELPGRARASPALLRSLFGLTESEAAVALMIADGLEVEAIAHERGVSRNTVKSLLQRAYAKTGAPSQRALMRLLLAIAAGLSR